MARPPLLTRRPACFIAVLVVLAGSVVPCGASAQVFQVQGGGSTLFSGYGGAVNVWGDRFEGSLGVGYLDGIRLGVRARRLVHGRDTLGLGNEVLSLALPTDILGGGTGLVMAQGVSWQQRRGRTTLQAFGGASAEALAAPFFAANRAARPMTYVHATHDLSNRLSVGVHGVATSRQSLIGSVLWRPSLGVAASAAGGVGSNSPYAALSLSSRSSRLDVKGGLFVLGRRFKRAEAPMPLQAESERENLLVTWRPREGLSLSAGRQHFRQDSVFRQIAPRATLTQLGMSARPWGASLSGGLFLSSAAQQRNVSSFVSARTPANRWGEAELYLLRVWDPVPARITTPVLLLREHVTSRYSLLQVITRSQGRTSASFGGALNTALSSFSLDYQLVHSPYLTTNPFVQTIGVNARVQLKGYAVSFGSFVTPDGKVHYSAQGSTFMYRGTAETVGRRDGSSATLARWIVSGEVVDESGAAVQGAAVSVDGETVYTDSRGRFFVRRPTGRAVEVRLMPDDFITDLRYEVVTPPARVTTVRDERLRGVIFTVRRVAPATRP